MKDAFCGLQTPSSSDKDAVPLEDLGDQIIYANTDQFLCSWEALTPKNGGMSKRGAESFSLVRTDTFISKTKKLYMDTRTQRNMAKLSEDISEVHSIMTRNIADVLDQGERLDSKLPPSHAACQDGHMALRSGFRMHPLRMFWGMILLCWQSHAKV